MVGQTLNETAHLLTEKYFKDPQIWSCDIFEKLYNKMNDPAEWGDGSITRAQITLQIVLYSLACGIGLIGNVLILGAFIFNAQLRTLPNYFIANLAVSDLLMCVFTAPFTLQLIQKTFWPLGKPACIMVASASAVNLFASTFSLTGIGLHRFALTKFPIKFQHNRSLPFFGILLIWILSLLLSFPIGFGAKVSTLTSQTRLWTPWSYKNKTGFQDFLAKNCGLPDPEMCIEDWSEMFISQTAFSLLCTLIQYILPLVTLCLFYWHVGTTVQERANFRQTLMRQDDSKGRQQIATAQRRTFILLFSLVVAFACLWFPWNLYNTLSNFHVIKLSMVSQFVYVYLCGILTATVNPILYGLFNENFRAVFRKLFSKFKRAPLDTEINSQTTKMVPLVNRSGNVSLLLNENNGVNKISILVI